MSLTRIIMMEEPLERVQWEAPEDPAPWIRSHPLYPVALLSGDEHWVQRIAEELHLEESIVQQVIDDEGERA